MMTATSPGYSAVVTQDCPFYGCEFLRKPDGTIVPVRKGGKPLDGIAAQIIARQKFVGQYSYTDDEGNLQVSGEYGKRSKYVSDFGLPPELKSGLTAPRGLQQNGTVTGWFAHQNGTHPQSGFVARDGVASAYDDPDPNAAITQFEHVNKKGLIAGAWYNSGQTTSGAFIFDSRRARFKPIDVSGATLPFASSVNDAGIVTVGDGDGSSYIYCPHKKTCPLQAGAIEIPERWIAARPVAIRASSLNHASHPLPRVGRQLLKESGLQFWH
ncbi:MAG TPA: hypothetical protein VHU18_07810 [Rhizomicrobium sp.]|jgi:hypothetical protein|nr:hypothetical protein [Rhizomicrobium sp.]